MRSSLLSSICFLGVLGAQVRDSPQARCIFDSKEYPTPRLDALVGACQVAVDASFCGVPIDPGSLACSLQRVTSAAKDLLEQEYSAVWTGPAHPGWSAVVQFKREFDVFARELQVSQADSHNSDSMLHPSAEGIIKRHNDELEYARATEKAQWKLFRNREILLHPDSAPLLRQAVEAVSTVDLIVGMANACYLGVSIGDVQPLHTRMSDCIRAGIEFASMVYRSLGLIKAWTWVPMTIASLDQDIAQLAGLSGSLDRFESHLSQTLSDASLSSDSSLSINLCLIPITRFFFNAKELLTRPAILSLAHLRQRILMPDACFISNPRDVQQLYERVQETFRGLFSHPVWKLRGLFFEKLETITSNHLCSGPFLPKSTQALRLMLDRLEKPCAESFSRIPGNNSGCGELARALLRKADIFQYGSSSEQDEIRGIVERLLKVARRIELTEGPLDHDTEATLCKIEGHYLKAELAEKGGYWKAIVGNIGGGIVYSLEAEVRGGKTWCDKFTQEMGYVWRRRLEPSSELAMTEEELLQEWSMIISKMLIIAAELPVIEGLISRDNERSTSPEAKYAAYRWLFERLAQEEQTVYHAMQKASGMQDHCKLGALNWLALAPIKLQLQDLLCALERACIPTHDIHASISVHRPPSLCG